MWSGWEEVCERLLRADGGEGNKKKPKSTRDVSWRRIEEKVGAMEDD